MEEYGLPTEFGSMKRGRGGGDRGNRGNRGDGGGQPAEKKQRVDQQGGYRARGSGRPGRGGSGGYRGGRFSISNRGGRGGRGGGHSDERPPDGSRFFRKSMVSDPWARLGEGTEWGPGPLEEGLMNDKGEVLRRVYRPGRGGPAGGGAFGGNRGIGGGRGGRDRYYSDFNSGPSSNSNYTPLAARGGPSYGAGPPTGPVGNEDEIQLDLDEDEDDEAGEANAMEGVEHGEALSTQIAGGNGEEIAIDFDEDEE